VKWGCTCTKWGVHVKRGVRAHKVRGMLIDEAHTCEAKGRSVQRHKCMHEGMSACAKVRGCAQRCEGA
jgi:hypothetical protein